MLYQWPPASPHSYCSIASGLQMVAGALPLLPGASAPLRALSILLPGKELPLLGLCHGPHPSSWDRMTSALENVQREWLLLMMSYGSLMWLTVACSPPGNSIWDIPCSPTLPFYHPLPSFLSESIRFQMCICQTFELAQVQVRAVAVCSLIPGTILTRLILNLCVCVGRGLF